MNLPRPNLIRYTRSQRLAILLLLAMIIGVEILGYVIINNEDKTEPIEIPSEVLARQSEIEKSGNPNFVYRSSEMGKFDPNELNSQQWQGLGFSSKQVQTIFKYKKSLGGRFDSKEQIKKCYVISAEKFAELEPYIIFSENKFKEPGKYGNRQKSRIDYRKFNPNDYSQKDWENIGFSEKQAQTILKYKRSLGGKFSSLEEIRKCYVISEGKFDEMKPYIILASSGKLKEIITEHEVSVTRITKLIRII